MILHICASDRTFTHSMITLKSCYTCMKDKKHSAYVRSPWQFLISFSVCPIYMSVFNPKRRKIEAIEFFSGRRVAPNLWKLKLGFFLL